MAELADIGVIGLGVMGENLILNLDEHKIKVVGFNPIKPTINDFLNGIGKNTQVLPASSMTDFVGKLSLPRKVFLMVKAGDITQMLIEQLTPLLSEGDIIIDGGNSNYLDTNKRCEILEKKGIKFVGMGVSGGEFGARNGPSLMPGGTLSAWSHISDIFQSIAAKTTSGEPCCDWIGKNGSGHFVKMVHNGIEYGDMQLICEIYHFMHSILKFSNEECSEIFKSWTNSKLDSYLIEITAKILKYKDSDDHCLVDKILDKAGQKGTGKWTGINALELGVPVTLISEAVFSRYLSTLKEQRIIASKIFIKPEYINNKDKQYWANLLENALLGAKIISYAQGFMLMKKASDEYNWDIDLSKISLLWRNGCIIRSIFLTDISKAYSNNKNLDFLGLDPYFMDILNEILPSWREVVSLGIKNGLPMPCMNSALTFLDGYSCANLPANLLQAQRDFFGSHTYQRIDSDPNKFFHTNW